MYVSESDIRAALRSGKGTDWERVAKLIDSSDHGTGELEDMKYDIQLLKGIVSRMALTLLKYRIPRSAVVGILNPYGLTPKDGDEDRDEDEGSYR